VGEGAVWAGNPHSQYATVAAFNALSATVTALASTVSGIGASAIYSIDDQGAVANAINLRDDLPNPYMRDVDNDDIMRGWDEDNDAPIAYTHWSTPDPKTLVSPHKPVAARHIWKRR
jgi:hypothetical protein